MSGSEIVIWVALAYVVLREAVHLTVLRRTPGRSTERGRRKCK